LIKELRSVKIVTILITFILFFLLFLTFTHPSSIYAENAQRTFRVGEYQNYPKIYIDENGNVSGIFPDILAYIAEKENWKIEYVHGNWTECLDRLEKGEIDIMPDVAYSDERALLYDFTNETVFVNWGVIYSGKNGNIQSILDLDKKKVAVMKGSIHTSGEEGIELMTEKFEIDTTYIEVEDYTKVFEMVDKNEADAGVVNRVFGDAFEKDYKLKKTPIVFGPSKLKFGLHKGALQNKYITETIDKHVFDLTKDPYSIYYQSLNKYFPRIDNRKIVEKVPLWLFIVLAVAISLLTISFFINKVLNRRVNVKTKALKLSNEELQQKIKIQKETEIHLKESEKNLKEKVNEYESLLKLTIGREKEMATLKEKLETESPTS
jgi:ABC-type amino acid transport substrate-binding protein